MVGCFVAGYDGLATNRNKGGSSGKIEKSRTVYGNAADCGEAPEIVKASQQFPQQMMVLSKMIFPFYQLPTVGICPSPLTVPIARTARAAGGQVRV